jgi:long-subunit fatty acid transport protein
MNRSIAAAALGAVAGLAGAAAHADSLSPGDERFKFVAGWFLPAFNTDVRIDDAGTAGDKVRLGDDLGVDEDQSGVLLGFEWRIAERHRLGATYSSFSQSGNRVIDREITIGDEVYPVDATLNTKWSIDLIPITYSYSFIKNESNELAGTFGIHWDKVSLRLHGTTSLSDEDFNADASGSADLPLPMIGLRYDHHFSDNWSAGAGAAFFSISFGDTGVDAKGSLQNIRAYTEYRFAGRYGVGLAIDAFKLKVEADKPRLTGVYKYDYWGPQLYLTARF